MGISDNIILTSLHRIMKLPSETCEAEWRKSNDLNDFRFDDEVNTK